MSKSGAPLLLLLVCSLGLGACNSRAADKPASSKAADKGGKPKLPELPPGSAVCDLDTIAPGPLRRGGKARVQLVGDGLSIDLSEVPAICGPLFNGDIKALDVHAGDGVLFEACVPEGMLQISSWVRTPGKQSVHGADEGGGTEVLFNRNKAGTYTTRAASTDSLVFSEDLWKAEADLVLHSVAGTGQVRAKVTFDCPPVGPWADDAPSKEPAKAP